MVNKMEEDENDRRKEIGLIKNQLQKVFHISNKRIGKNRAGIVFT